MTTNITQTHLLQRIIIPHPIFFSPHKKSLSILHYQLSIKKAVPLPNNYAHYDH